MAGMLATACGKGSTSGNQKKHVGKEEISVQTESQQNISKDEQNINTEQLFKGKLEEKINQYGIFESEQSSIIKDLSTKWFNPNGVITANLDDYDMDGADEMLLFCSEKCDDLEGNHIKMEMYEIENGEVKLADVKIFGAYLDKADGGKVINNLYETRLQENNFADRIIEVTNVDINGKNYIVCENFSLTKAFEDRLSNEYWILEYKDSKINMAGSLVGMESGTDNFVYIAYYFENGNKVASDIMYSWDSSGIYKTFGYSTKMFFDNFQILIKDAVASYTGVGSPLKKGVMQTVLHENNKSNVIFAYTNTSMETEANAREYRFSSVLRKGKNLIDNEAFENVKDDTKSYKDAYKQTIEDYGTTALKYAIYDMNDDDVPELILTSFPESRNDVFTYDGKEVIRCGRIIEYNENIKEYDGEGFAVYEWGAGQTDYLKIYTLENNKLQSSTLMEGFDYDSKLATYEKADYMKKMTFYEIANEEGIR